MLSPEGNLYIAIQEQIRDTVPEVAFIDIFQGNAEINKAAFPSINNSVFVDISNINWKRLNKNIQQGFATVIIYVSFRRLAASYATQNAVSTNRVKALEFYEVANKVYQSLSEYKTDFFSGLERLNSQPITNTKELFIYQHTFTCNLYDDTALNETFTAQNIKIEKV